MFPYIPRPLVPLTRTGPYDQWSLSPTYLFPSLPDSPHRTTARGSHGAPLGAGCRGPPRDRGGSNPWCTLTSSPTPHDRHGVGTCRAWDPYDVSIRPCGGVVVWSSATRGVARSLSPLPRPPPLFCLCSAATRPRLSKMQPMVCVPLCCLYVHCVGSCSRGEHWVTWRISFSCP